MKLIDEFKAYLQALGYGKSTVRMLPACVSEFFEIVKKSPEEITREDVLFYHKYLQQRPNKRSAGGLSEMTIKHHLYGVKLLFVWLLEQGEITSHPMSGLSFQAPKTKERIVLSKGEIMKLYRTCLTYGEKAILSIYYGCGLRRSEGEKLDITDVHFASSLLYVRDGKGHKRRVVPMGKKVKEDLENYLKYERCNTIETKAFLLNIQDNRMSGSSCNNRLKELTRRAGMDKTVSLHILRHSIATHLLESGLSLEYVRDFLGHKHLETTQVYTHLESHQLWNL